MSEMNQSKNTVSGYLETDALGMAELVRTGELSPKELLEDARSRLQVINPKINAVICPMDELAEKLINRIDTTAPFCGVPFLVKDLMLPFADYPMSNGSNAMKQYVPDSSSHMAKKIINAGLIVFGKTNTSELGASSLTMPVAFGETKNPWNLELNSGGSSGGSSAAVASRIVPMAYSSDGGGSIRYPASYCGVFGYKPSRGLNPDEDFTKAWGHAVVSHVTTLTVRDSAAYLDVAASRGGISYREMTGTPDSYLNSLKKTPSGLKIGLICDSPINTPVNPDCITAAETAARVCESLGHHIETSEWNFDGRELMKAFLTIVFKYTARDVQDMASLLNKPAAKIDIEINTRFMATVGSGIKDDQMAWAFDTWQRAARQLSAMHKNFDVILTPTTATEPLPSSALDPTGLEKLAMRVLISTGLGKKVFSDQFMQVLMDKAIYQTPFTPIANITGQPAMSVPLYWDKNNLPYGAHFMAAEGNDRLLLQLAAQLEMATPWYSRLPPLLLS